ncbi:MAG TPA: phenylalanine--tRNA ligase subunit beta [Saprospiraceae bacterium]|nr:phenylalanine--tRNA ligase subunit beta [Saprospiraceae bacterium]HMQ85233.1 phenylalanine--tRNA ligase subunit beta [Saprospiraceae bacterium]
MKVSLNWLREYIDIDLSPESVGELLTGLGLEVEGMEKTESIKGGLEGVVVGWVKERWQHPNADRLSLTKVDVGTGEELQIVCGAPNVAAGQKVLVATIGSVLYPNGGEEALEIKKGKIRGETSEGMICAQDELGIGQDHSGIMVLPEDTPVGMSAREYLQLETDYIFEIGLTPNRSDATNQLGVAKDLAAYLKFNNNYEGGVRLPDVNAFQVDNNSLPVEVVVENSEACPRYTAVVIKGIQVGESPEWLKRRLAAVGVRPINNIVDITNFVLHELGQPLHAFDLDQIAGQKVIVKTLPEGTKFISLDEAERKLSSKDLMICNGNSEGMCIGGVFGGIHSGVTEDTQHIFLESAHFNPKWIRRSSMHHNLRTDAAKVFEKGSDPNITLYALKRAALLIKELAGGEIASEVVDLYPNPVAPKQVRVRFERINRLIGIEITRAEVLSVLQALDMAILEQTETDVLVTVPTNKSDVYREVDVIEEILRIYDYNKVPIPPQVKSGINVSPKPDPVALRNTIADLLASLGFVEMMAMSLTQSRYYKELSTFIPEERLVYINNTSTVQLDIMRPEMLFSGLEAIVYNQNRQQLHLKLFEFGRSYQKTESGTYQEDQHLSLFLTGNRLPENWHNTSNGNVNFYTLKRFVELVLKRLGVQNYQEEQLSEGAYAYALRYYRGAAELVRFGKISPNLCKQMGIKGEVFCADFNWDLMLKAVSKQDISFRELNKFPSVRRDLALVVDNSTKFSDIVAIASKTGKKLLKETNLFDVYENEEQLGKGKKSYAVSFLFEDSSKTLKDEEVDQVMKKLITGYETQLGAVIRR